MCASPISPSISALGTSAATESTTIRSTAPGADQLVGDLQRLLAVVGLRHQQVLDLHPQLARVADVQRVLGVDEGADAAGALGLGDGVQGQRGLARRLGAVDLDHPPARQPAHPERQVQAHRAGGDDRRSRRSRRPPSGMIAPLPNCFSIAAIAPATAFIFSLMRGHESLLCSFGSVGWVRSGVVGRARGTARPRRGAGRAPSGSPRDRRWCAPTRRMRVIARADSPSRVDRPLEQAVARRRRAAPPRPARAACRRALRRGPRARCRSRAATTRARTVARRLAGRARAASSWYGSAGTSTCRSIRSSSGPDSRAR